MNNLISWLKRPYPNSASWKSELVTGVAISTFIFLFLRLFQPFGLHNEFPYKNMIIGGFGLVTFLAYAIETFLLPQFLPQFYLEEKWTTGKQLLMSISTVILIAIGNWTYLVALGFTTFSYVSGLGLILNTFLVGSFPVTIMVIITEMRLLKLHSNASEAVNQGIQNAALELPDPDEIQILNEDGKPALEIDPAKVIYITSADNYVEVHIQENEQTRKQLVRSSLRGMENQLSGNTNFFRCHRSYLINLQHVEHSEGNSAGLRLDLNHVSTQIPVSRSYVSKFRAAIQD